MSSRALTVGGFVALAVVALALAGAGQRRRLGLVPVGELLAALRASRSGRLVAVLAWAWLGWHLLAR